MFSRGNRGDKVAILFELICYFYSLMFFVSFLSKLLAFQPFQWSIKEFKIVKDRRLIFMVAVGMLFLEITLAISFSFLQYVQISFVIVCLLMLLFIVLFIRSLRNKQSISCHCFGHQNNFTNIQRAIARNAIILFMSILGLALYKPVEMDWSGQTHMLFLLIGSALFFEVFRSSWHDWKQATG